MEKAAGRVKAACPPVAPAAIRSCMSTPDLDRDRRLAEALRANLKRRKEQARAAAAPAEGDGDGDGGPPLTPPVREP